ncbi:MAG: adenylyltransferase/cytidyltransferase family protein, partial [Clostridia bacterium]|nr:adenylyltransferase/cytidyltransferase family protein [Clostridia bacterium]
MKDAIAVITGTFNPVHKAHINLGKQVLKKFPYIKKIIYV